MDPGAAPSCLLALELHHREGGCFAEPQAGMACVRLLWACVLHAGWAPCQDGAWPGAGRGPHTPALLETAFTPRTTTTWHPSQGDMCVSPCETWAPITHDSHMTHPVHTQHTCFSHVAHASSHKQHACFLCGWPVLFSYVILPLPCDVCFLPHEMCVCSNETCAGGNGPAGRRGDAW